VNSAPDVKVPHHLHPLGSDRCHQIVKDLISNGFMKCSLVPVGPKVEFEGLQFNAEGVRHVVDLDSRKIWLTCQGTDTGELWAFKVHLKLSTRPGTWKAFQLFAGDTRHKLFALLFNAKALCEPVKPAT